MAKATPKSKFKKNDFDKIDKLELFRMGKDYKELVKKHNLTESGTWVVWSENQTLETYIAPNYKFLGVYSGTLKFVIEVAVTLPEFWNFGEGGWIQKVDVVNVTAQTAVIRRNRQKRMAQLVEELDKLKEEDSRVEEG